MQNVSVGCRTDFSLLQSGFVSDIDHLASVRNGFVSDLGTLHPCEAFPSVPYASLHHEVWQMRWSGLTLFLVVSQCRDVDQIDAEVEV